MADESTAKRPTKEQLVLSFANAEKLSDVLLGLGYFCEAKVTRIKCPYLIPDGWACKTKDANQSCKWNWETVGANPDCPNDQQLKLALEESRKAGIKGALTKSMKFVLEEVHGKHTVDLAVRVPGEELRVNECFAILHKSPSLYFVIFDLDLKSFLKAIRYAHLLLVDYSEFSWKPQLIIVTLNASQQLKQTIENQGIRVHIARWPQ
jgi:hypothetical protein